MIGIIGLIVIGVGLIVWIFGVVSNSQDSGFIKGVGGAILAVGLLVFGLRLFTTVDAGEVVVPIQFGEVLEPIQQEGFTPISPFASRISMPIRTVEISFIGQSGGETTGDDESGLRSIQALSSEGAQVGVDVTVLYHIDPTKAGTVYRTVGTAWEEVLVIPHARNTVRDCLPEYSFEEARTSKRGEAALCMLNQMQESLGHRGIIIEDVLLRELKADAQLQAAIDEKLEAQSNAQRAEFEQREAVVRAETARIEAEGLANAQIERAKGEAEAIRLRAIAEADANDLIAASLTDALLQLRIYEQLGDKTVVISDGTTAPLPILPIGD